MNQKDNRRIVLKSSEPIDTYLGTVRVTPEAERVLRRIQARTALPLRRIVSEIIIQAEPLIEIEVEGKERVTCQE